MVKDWHYFTFANLSLMSDLIEGKFILISTSSVGGTSTFFVELYDQNLASYQYIVGMWELF